MTHPISNERVEWLQSRAKVVDECIRITQSEMYPLTGGAGLRQDLSQALNEFNAERVAIAVELRVLLTHFSVSP